VSDDVIRRFEVVDNVGDERCPYALVDRCEGSKTEDLIVRIGPLPAWLSDYAFECELADEVTYQGVFLLKVEGERDSWRPRLRNVPKTEAP
jgi:hypothetical protein